MGLKLAQTRTNHKKGIRLYSICYFSIYFLLLLILSLLIKLMTSWLRSGQLKYLVIIVGTLFQLGHNSEDKQQCWCPPEASYSRVGVRSSRLSQWTRATISQLHIHTHSRQCRISAKGRIIALPLLPPLCIFSHSLSFSHSPSSWSRSGSHSHGRSCFQILVLVLWICLSRISSHVPPNSIANVIPI